MSLYKDCRNLNKRIWNIITNISFDETESKQIIDAMLEYGHLTRTRCRSQQAEQKLAEKILYDIATIKEETIEIDNKTEKILKTKKITLNIE